jgi:hypothetical protein
MRRTLRCPSCKQNALHGGVYSFSCKACHEEFAVNVTPLGWLVRSFFGVASTIALYVGVLVAGSYWWVLVALLTALGYVVATRTARPRASSAS